MFGLKKKRRRKIKAQPFPPKWREIIRRNVPYFAFLTPEEQEELKGHVQVFLAEKRFEGAGGLKITDEIRVTIAAQACVLLLNREATYYPALKTVVVYPHDYAVKSEEELPGGIVSEGMETRAGESWYRGEVILSWDAVARGAVDIRNGHNVVYHEFAHQLDAEWGEHDGAPVLPRKSMYLAWARVLGREYEELIDNIAHHRRTTLDRYAAENPAEFFAVVTEVFFEKPSQLKKYHPELYDQFTLFYQQNPAEKMKKGRNSCPE